MSDRDLRRPDSILIRPAGALGDTLLAYPAAAALRAWAPKALITLAARSAYGTFALSAGTVDRIEDTDGFTGGSRFAGPGVTAIPPDLAVVWSSAYRDLARQFEEQGTRSIIAAPPFPSDDRHQARYLLDCLRPLGIPRALTAAPVPHLPPLSPAEEVLLGQDGPTVLLHPGAGARWKQWPIDAWLALADALEARGYTVRWSHGPDDEEVRDTLLGRCSAIRAALWPEQTLPRFAAILARCGLLVSGDTGVAHLAALLRVPQVTMFGPTDPRRWRPLSRFAVIARSPDICGGRWDRAAGDATGPPRIRRCVEQTDALCLCLAALPAETIISLSLRILLGKFRLAHGSPRKLLSRSPTARSRPRSEG